MQADHIDSKAVLWASVLALMVKNYGRENLNRLAREAKIGPGTASRLKAQETSVGLDTIDSNHQAKPERPRFDAHTATTSDAKNQKNKSPISTSAKPL